MKKLFSSMLALCCMLLPITAYANPGDHTDAIPPQGIPEGYVEETPLENDDRYSGSTLDHATLNDDANVVDPSTLSIQEIAQALFGATMDTDGFEKSYDVSDKSLDIYLGNEIPVYNLVDGKLSKHSNIRNFPVLNGNDIIGFLKIINDSGNEPTYTMTPYQAKEVNNFYKTNSMAAIVLSVEATILAGNNDVVISDLHSKDEVDSITKTKLSVNAISKAATRNLEQVQDISNTHIKYASQDSKIALDIEPPITTKGSTPQASVSQGSTTILPWIQGDYVCWVPVMKSVGDPKTGTSKPLSSLGLSTNSMTIARDFWNDVYKYSGSNTYMSMRIYGSEVGWDNIRNFITSDCPIVANCSSPGRSNHAITISGFGLRNVNGSASVQTVTAMNPWYAVLETMTKSGGYFKTASKNGTVWTWDQNAMTISRWDRNRKLNNSWCWINNNGTRHTGWKQLGSNWYLMDDSGITQMKGWCTASNIWYYFDKSTGAMKRGWLKDGGNWFYLRTALNTPTSGKDGSLTLGWFKIGSWWYYARTSKDNIAAGPQGAILVGNKWRIGTKYYRFDADGRCTTPNGTAS